MKYGEIMKSAPDNESIIFPLTPEDYVEVVLYEQAARLRGVFIIERDFLVDRR